MKTTHQAKCGCGGQTIEVDVDNGEVVDQRIDGVSLPETAWRRIYGEVAARLLAEHEAGQA